MAMAYNSDGAYGNASGFPIMKFLALSITSV